MKIILFSRYLLSLLVQRKTDLVHQVVHFVLQRFDDFGGDEEVAVVQVLDDEFTAQSESVVQVEQELFHCRVAWEWIIEVRV